jgi:hypothetical protein
LIPRLAIQNLIDIRLNATRLLRRIRTEGLCHELDVERSLHQGVKGETGELGVGGERCDEGISRRVEERTQYACCEGWRRRADLGVHDDEGEEDGEDVRGGVAICDTGAVSARGYGRPCRREDASLDSGVVG